MRKASEGLKILKYLNILYCEYCKFVVFETSHLYSIEACLRKSTLQLDTVSLFILNSLLDWIQRIFLVDFVLNLFAIDM